MSNTHQIRVQISGPRTDSHPDFPAIPKFGKPIEAVVFKTRRLDEAEDVNVQFDTMPGRGGISIIADAGWWKVVVAQVQAQLDLPDPMP